MQVFYTKYRDILKKLFFAFFGRSSLRLYIIYNVHICNKKNPSEYRRGSR